MSPPPTDDRPPSVSVRLTLARRIDDVCVRFEAAWQAAGDTRPALEAFLADVPDSHRPLLAAELLPIEVFHRRRLGETPTPAEYAARLPTLDGDAVRAVFELTGDHDPADTPPEDRPAGRRPAEPETGLIAGRYLPGRVLGEGGMGTVYLAEQVAPVRRPVALKLIKPGMDTRRVVARFEAERQALARMDHPHIAKVLDAGTIPSPSPSGAGGRGEESLRSPPPPAGEGAGGWGPSGRPFFVMEYVPGVPLTDYCDAHQLPVRDRLVLFRQVCGAVQHAHQKGVIHRDLKPGNVLVAEADGKPAPKVIDFGLAKALGDPLADRPDETQTGAVLGTPLYMAPEQAGGDPADVDTRADVYALGAILYELLTGTTPVDRSRFRRADPDEVVRLIRDEEPPKPSARLSETQGGGRPVRALHFPDLDWVVMKALEKDRARRYDTAAALAEDVGRHLADEPVAAGPPSRVYRLRKFVRRNRGRVAAAGLVLVALLAGIGGTTAGLVEAREQRDAADTARGDAEARRTEAESRRAEAETARQAEAEQKGIAEAKKAEADEQRREAVKKADEAEAMIGFLIHQVFAAGRPVGQAGGLGKDVTLRKALAASLPALAERFKDQPLVEAKLRAGVGMTFFYLGEFGTAAAQVARARVLNTRLRGPDHPDTLECVHNLALVLSSQNRHADALGLREHALAGRTKAHGPDHPATLSTMNDLASSYAEVGRRKEALDLRERTLAIRRRVLGPDDPETLRSMHNLAMSYFETGRRPDALALTEQTLAARRRVLPADHPDTLASMGNLAECLSAAGRNPEALKLRQEALAARRRVLPADHPSTLGSMWAVAVGLSREGRWGESIPLIDECLGLALRQDVDPMLFDQLLNLRMTYYVRVGNPAECRATAVTWEKLGRRDANGLHKAAVYRSLASGVYAKKGQPAEAEGEADRAMAWLTQAVAAGYAGAAKLRSEGNLTPLRGREDFRRLAARAEAGLPPEPPPPQAPPPRAR